MSLASVTRQGKVATASANHGVDTYSLTSILSKMLTEQTLLSCLETFSKGSTGAVPSDIYGAHAFLVLNIYKVQLSYDRLPPLVQTSLQKAPDVLDEKKQDFIKYTLQWIASVGQHHQRVLHFYSFIKNCLGQLS